MTSIYLNRILVKNNVAIYVFYYYFISLLYFVFILSAVPVSFGPMTQCCLCFVSFLFFFNDMAVPVGFLFDLYWHANDRIQNRKVICVCTYISTLICGLCDLFKAVTPINNGVVNVILTTLVSRQHKNKTLVTSRD